MNTFTVQLCSATRAERIDGVRAFVAEDPSGSFALLAGHARFITTLSIGLARFQCQDQPWQYLALPGAVVYFKHDELSISTRRYFIDDDYTRVSAALQIQLITEEESLCAMKDSLHHMEGEMLKRLWRLGSSKQ